MNTFIKKEIRLLLPSWIVVMSLAALLPWLAWRDPDTSFAWMPVFVFFGMILLAVDSFGREFSLGTFPSLMSQPMERRQIWKTKITILFSAAALVFIAFFISSEFLFHHALNIPLWNANQKLINTDFRNGMLGCVVAISIALVGGLWTTLLIRQVAAAFWITFLAPLGTLMLIIFFLPNKFPDALVAPGLYGLAVIYNVTGFWFAHRLFHRAQDAAWTGGVISFSTWRYFKAGSANSISVRRQKPLTTLFKKEFQIHSISLFCAGVILVLHIGIFFLRAIDPNVRSNSTGLMAIASEFFWTLWLVMPLVIGCMAVAEERKLGVMDSQFCLAVSRRRQFVIKFFPTLFFGVLFGGIMPLALETMAACFGDSTGLFKAVTNQVATGHFFSENLLPYFTIIALSAGLTLIGFFASTLARNFMQALSVAIVIIVGCFFACTFFTDSPFARNEAAGFFGMKFWGGMPILIGLLTIITFIPWLAWRNFNHFTESGRLWRRNVFGITGALFFVFASSALIYNRIWELAKPAEPAHGAAKLSLSTPPILWNENYNNLLVRLPDSRVWFDYVSPPGMYYERSFKTLLNLWLGRTFPKNIGPQKFITGTNWLYASARHLDEAFSRPGSKDDFYLKGYTDSVGIKTDGTLWVSEKQDLSDTWTAEKLTQFGDETNWQQLARSYPITSVLLLKKDGTLWILGTNYFDLNTWSSDWPGLRAFKPYQVGTNSDWRAISSVGGYFAGKSDGTAWQIASKHKLSKYEPFRRETNFDQIPLDKLAQGSSSDFGAYIRPDGTLWFYEMDYELNKGSQFKLRKIDAETTWVSVVRTWETIAALKSDGTLWTWNSNRLRSDNQTGQLSVPPTRLGIHNDWVAITKVDGGIVSLAADGSLWFWPSPAYDGFLIKATLKPQFLANVFSKDD